MQAARRISRGLKQRDALVIAKTFDGIVIPDVLPEWVGSEVALASAA